MTAIRGPLTHPLSINFFLTSLLQCSLHLQVCACVRAFVCICVCVCVMLFKTEHPFVTDSHHFEQIRVSELIATLLKNPYICPTLKVELVMDKNINIY